MPEMPVMQVMQKYGLRGDLRGDEVYVSCPFHEEATPSLTINLKRGVFKCFGCGESGSMVDFVAKLAGTDHLEALQIIRVLRTVEPDEDVVFATIVRSVGGGGKGDVEYGWSSMHRIDWRRMRIDAPIAHYMLVRRSFSRATMEAFEVRMSNDSNYPVVFPLVMDGKMVGYQKRAVDDRKPKYLFNVGFEGDQNVYYLKIAEEPLLVVEGALDLMKAVQHGARHVAALFSWKLNEWKARWLGDRALGQLIVSGLDNTITGDEGTDLLRVAWGPSTKVRRLEFPTYAKDVCEMKAHEFRKAWMDATE